MQHYEVKKCLTCKAFTNHVEVDTTNGKAFQCETCGSFFEDVTQETYLQVIYHNRTNHCLVHQKVFSLDKCVKSFNLWHRSNSGQIVLRGSDKGYDPSWSENQIYVSTAYWNRSDYLRDFAKFLRIQVYRKVD